MAKIIQEHEKCISCGACVSVCPEHWEMGKDGKAILKGGKKVGKNFEKDVKDIGCNKEAADSCPVHIIKIK